MSKINLAELRAKLKELKDGQKGPSQDYIKKFLSIGEYDDDHPNRSVIRILPAASDDDNFFVETLLHKINGKNVHCPRFKKEACPICEYVKALWQTNDPKNIEKARQIKAKKRFYFNVISRERVVPDEKTGKDAIKTNDGPLIFSCGVKVFEKILKAMVDEDCGDLTDLKNGWDFRVIMEIKGEFPNYDDSKPRKDTSPAGTDEEIKTWMENLHNLSELISYKSFDELKEELKIFQGMSSETSETIVNEETNDSKKEENEKPSEDVGKVQKDAFLEELKKLQQDSEDDE